MKNLVVLLWFEFFKALLINYFLFFFLSTHVYFALLLFQLQVQTISVIF
jgi:hypothetical protein